MALGSAGSVFVDIEGDLSKIQKSLSDAVSQAGIAGTEVAKAFSAGTASGAGGLTSQLDAVGTKLQQIGGLATIAGGAVVAAVGAMAESAVPFDLAMRKVTSLIGDTSDAEFKKLEQDTLALSTAMGVDAVKSADALYQAISAGVPKDNAIEFMAVASKAAIAGVTDTKVAVDGLTTVIQAFGLQWKDATKVADAMFQAVNIGKETFPQLSSAIGIAAGTAHALGVSFQELLAASATLTLTTGQSVSQAMTMLESAMKAVLKPTAQMRDLIKQTGYESGEALIQAKGLEGALQAISDAAKGNITVLTTAFGRVEGLRGVLGLTGDNAAKAAEQLNLLKDSTGAATLAFNEIDKSTSRQFDRLTTELKNTAIEMGIELLPAVNDLLKSLKPLVDITVDAVKWFAKLPEPVRDITIAMIALAGPITTLTGTLLKLPAYITDVATALGILKTAEIEAGAAQNITGITTSLTNLKSVLNSFAGKAGIAAAVGVAIYEVGNAMLGTKTATDNAAASAADHANKLGDLQSASHGVTQAQKDLAGILASLPPIVNDNASASEKAAKEAIAHGDATAAAGAKHRDAVPQIKAHTDTVRDDTNQTLAALDAEKQLTATIERGSQAIEAAKPFIVSWTQNQKDLADSLGITLTTLPNVTSETDSLDEAVKKLAGSLKDGDTEFDGFITKINDAIIISPSATEAMDAIASGIKKVGDATVIAGQGLAGMTERLAEAGTAQRAYQDAVAKGPGQTGQGMGAMGESISGRSVNAVQLAGAIAAMGALEPGAAFMTSGGESGAALWQSFKFAYEQMTGLFNQFGTFVAPVNDLTDALGSAGHAAQQASDSINQFGESMSGAGDAARKAATASGDGANMVHVQGQALRSDLEQIAQQLASTGSAFTGNLSEKENQQVIERAGELRNSVNAVGSSFGTLSNTVQANIGTVSDLTSTIDDQATHVVKLTAMYMNQAAAAGRTLNYLDAYNMAVTGSIPQIEHASVAIGDFTDSLQANGSNVLTMTSMLMNAAAAAGQTLNYLDAYRQAWERINGSNPNDPRYRAPSGPSVSGPAGVVMMPNIPSSGNGLSSTTFGNGTSFGMPTGLSPNSGHSLTVNINGGTFSSNRLVDEIAGQITDRFRLQLQAHL